MDRVPTPVRTLPVQDLRSLDIAELPAELESLWKGYPDGFWSVARKPGRRWTSSISWARPLILASAPLYELILWIPLEATVQLPEDVVGTHNLLLGRYKELFDSLDPEKERQYLARLQQHIERSEAEVYRPLEKVPYVDRSIREMRYERQGLNKGLSQLSECLAAARSNNLEKARRERLDLDFFHLLEHHLEREKDAIYPSWVFLNQG